MYIDVDESAIVINTSYESYGKISNASEDMMDAILPMALIQAYPENKSLSSEAFGMLYWQSFNM